MIKLKRGEITAYGSSSVNTTYVCQSGEAEITLGARDYGLVPSSWVIVRAGESHGFRAITDCVIRSE